MPTLKSASIVTFKTAEKYGFDLQQWTEEELEAYGHVVHEPKQSDFHIVYHWQEDEDEGGELMEGDHVFGLMECSCGCKWADVIDLDEMCALNTVECPDCKRWHNLCEHEVNDSAQFKRTLRVAAQHAKGGRK